MGLGGEQDRERDTAVDTNGEEKVVEVTTEVEVSWGTLEKLLLACAVSRYGTNSWDSIAKELRKRIISTSENKNHCNHHSHQNINASSSNTVFTPHACKKKYIELKRRYSSTTAAASAVYVSNGGGDDEDGKGEESAANELTFMVDELRKLRVEELKREVQHHDDSIVSLQMKVKRLEEESKKSVKVEGQEEDEMVAKKSDLKSEPEGNEKRSGEKLSEPERSAAMIEKETTVKSVPGKGSDVQREDRSFNESNSTNSKGSEVENRTGKETAMGKTREEESESTIEPERSENNEPDRYRSTNVVEPLKTSSASGGGAETKMLANGSGNRRGAVESRNTSRQGDAVSESKGGDGGEETRQQTQSSEVQSSASLSRRKKRRAGVGGWKASVGVGSSSCDDGTEEPISPANKPRSVKSNPLFRFMEILRSHKHGSVFERRLPSQDTDKYRNLIRQHMDLEAVQSKLDKGFYSHCHQRFYRDLILVFTNAMLFYRKSSAEHQAARELRNMVNKEIAQRTQKPKPVPTTMTERKQQQHLDPVVKKPRSTTMVVCRRRVTDQSTNKKEEDIKMESKRPVEIMKPEVDPKKANQSQVNKVDEHNDCSKKLSRQVSSLGSRKNEVSNKRNNKEIKHEVRRKKVVSSSDDEEDMDTLRSRKNVITNKKKSKEIKRVVRSKKEDNSSDEEEEDTEETKEEKREKLLTGSKKQGAADFLKRIKENSPSRDINAEKRNHETNHAEGLKKKKTDSKRGIINKENDDDYKRKDSRQEKVRDETSGKRVLEGGASERGGLERGGRPPKRKAAMMSPPESPISKKKKDSGGGDFARPRKKPGR